MNQAPVVCPQCKNRFRIPIGQKKGMCPHCQASLIFEIITPPKRKRGQALPHYEEHLNRGVFTELIDTTIHKKSQDFHPPRVQDIAVISTLDPPEQLSRIEKSVDRLLRTRG